MKSRTLLLILPGSEARLPVLSRMREVVDICVLVLSADSERASWAKKVVGEDNWIEAKGTLSDIDVAFEAVQTWLSAPGTSRMLDGVMTYDDFACELCAQLCERLEVPGTPVATMTMLKDKERFRRRCAEAGLPAVPNRRIMAGQDIETILQDADVRFPAVLKPAKGGGSWYVCKVNCAEEMRKIWERMSASMQLGSFPAEIRDAGFVLEEYFPGAEVDVDGWARNGKVEFMMVSDNRPASEPHFLEMGGIYPSQLRPEAVAVLEKLTQQVVEAFPNIHSCFHFEAKINEETLEAMPIEFNARVGGAECPASVEAVTGYYLPSVAAKLALNEQCSPEDPRYAVVASTNLHVHEPGTLTECTAEFVDVVNTSLVTSYMLGSGLPRAHVPNNGSMSCLGWLAAGGTTAEQAEQKLLSAISQTRIKVVP